MTGKISCYFDCVSPFSWYACKYLSDNSDALKSYDVEIDFIPVFLGGINVLSGNKPPWTLPAKAKYDKFDRPRASAYFGIPYTPAPEFFPILSIFPQRCLIYIKANHTRDAYERAFMSMFTALWGRNPTDISKPATLAETLTSIFDADDVKKIITAGAEQEFKDLLSSNTKEAVEKGAFGAPFYWVRNSQGKEEPFFGSDRFHYMWDYLGLPLQHLAIKEKVKAKM